MSDEQNRPEEETKDAPFQMGVFGDHPPGKSFSAADMIALSLSVLWLGACILFFATIGFGNAPEPFVYVVGTLAVVMPIAMVWLASAAAKSARVIRDESERIQTTIDAMRHVYIETQQEHSSTSFSPALEKRLAEITELALAAQRAAVAAQTETTPTEPETPPEDPNQTELALDISPEQPQPFLTTSDLLTALNFPADAGDNDGFRAMKAALEDRRTADLMRAAQDLLTLLSEDGIYMDDLHPDRTRPELWRRFAGGERGESMSGLAAIRDRSCLSLTAARMRQDSVFRDTAHHFINRFDKLLEDFVSSATDEELIKLSDTRTARAFMLLSKVSGTFDQT